MATPSNQSTKASLELLYSISRELATSIDLHQVLNQVLFLCVNNVGAERGSLIVLDDHQKPVDAAMVYRKQLIPHTSQQLQATLEQGLAGWVVQHREAVLINDTLQDERWLRRPDDRQDRSGAKSAICIPLMARDKLVGVLTAVHPEPGFLKEDSLYLLQAIADQAGVVIYNARLYDALQAAHHRYRELFEDSIVPIFITTPSGLIIEANRQAISFSDYEFSNLVEHNIFDLHEPQMEILGNNLENLSEHNTISYESELKAREKTIPIEIYVRKVQIDAETYLQWTMQDITERIELDALRENLSAMIYHDLRSPLSNIISSLDMLNVLASPQVAPNLQSVLSIANRSTDRMQRLISSLLDINRLEAGQPITDQKKIEYTSLISEAIQAVQPMLEHKNQILSIQIPEKLPKVTVDPDMIRRVVINLLENASKFTNNEGRIGIEIQLKDHWLETIISDNGPGIPKEAREDIFKKFIRLHGENVPKGLGLGLNFCQLAVNAHGGKIWVESESNQGSQFIFTLPVF